MRIRARKQGFQSPNPLPVLTNRNEIHQVRVDLGRFIVLVLRIVSVLISYLRLILLGGLGATSTSRRLQNRWSATQHLREAPHSSLPWLLDSSPDTYARIHTGDRYYFTSNAPHLWKWLRIMRMRIKKTLPNLSR